MLLEVPLIQTQIAANDRNKIRLCWSNCHPIQRKGHTMNLDASLANQSFVPAAGRIVIAAIFLSSGIGKLLEIGRASCRERV